MRLPALILLIAGVTGAAAAAPGAEVSRQYLAYAKWISASAMARDPDQAGEHAPQQPGCLVESGREGPKWCGGYGEGGIHDLPGRARAPRRGGKTCADNPGPRLGRPLHRWRGSAVPARKCQQHLHVHGRRLSKARSPRGIRNLACCGCSGWRLLFLGRLVEIAHGES